MSDPLKANDLLAGQPQSPASGPRQSLGGPQAAVSTSGGLSQLVDLQQKITRLHRTVRLTIEAELLSLAGRSFGELQANVEVVELLQAALETHGLRIQCPECGHPAILRCSPRPGVPTGAFVLDHTIDGRRTFHGGYASLPMMRLMAKPPRRSRREAS